MIKVGRSVLLFGSPAQIASRLKGNGHSQTGGVSQDEGSDDIEVSVSSSGSDNLAHLSAPPILPDRLSPGQAAQLCEVLEFLHLQLRTLMGAATVQEKDDEKSQVVIEARQWFQLTQLQCQIAQYLKEIGEPRAEG